jgi:hypothetical protein
LKKRSHWNDGIVAAFPDNGGFGDAGGFVEHLLFERFARALEFAQFLQISRNRPLDAGDVESQIGNVRRIGDPLIEALLGRGSLDLDSFRGVRGTVQTGAEDAASDSKE